MVREGSLSGFSNTRWVAIFHAAGSSLIGWERSLWSMTLSDSFIIELRRPTDGPIDSGKGREFVRLQ